MSQVIKNVLTGLKSRMPAAIESGFNPPDPDHLRIVVTGRPGSGKTSFAASNPRALLFDLEKGAGSVSDPACLRAILPSTSTAPADDLRKSVDSVLKEYRTSSQLRESLSTIVFDSFDAMVEMFLRDLRQKNNLEDAGDYKGGHGKGYFVVRDEIFGILDNIHRAGLGWVLIAHLSLKDVNGVMVPALNVSKTFRDTLVRSRDLQFKMDCARAVKESTTKSGAKVRLPSKDPKDRQYVLITDTTTVAADYDGPKANVPLESGLVIPQHGGWAAFRAAYEKAVEVRRNQLTNGS